MAWQSSNLSILAGIRRSSRPVGGAISKDDLAREIWGDTVVDDVANNLSKQMGSLRKKLGTNRSGEPYIRNVPNKGYILSVPVTIRTEKPEVNAPKISDVDSEQARNTPQNLPDEREQHSKQKPQQGLEDADSPPVRGEQNVSPGDAAASRASAPERHSLVSRWATATIFSSIVLISAVFISWILFASTGKALRKHQTRLVATVLPFRPWPKATDLVELSGLVTEMIRTDLGTAQSIRVVSTEQTEEVFSLDSEQNSGAANLATVARARKRLRADLVVSGSVTRLVDSGDVRIDIRVQDALTGDTVASESIAGPLGSLLELIPRCAALLRAKVWNGDPSEAEKVALREILPANLEAAQVYSLGSARLRASDALGARVLLQAASRSDPQSAIIRSALAEAWAALGYEGKAKDEARIAFKNASRLSREQQLLIEGRYRELSRDWVPAIASYGALWKFFPDDLEHGLRLVRAETAAGKPADAERTLAEMRRTPDKEDPRIDVAEAASAEAVGDFRRELTAARRAIQKGQTEGKRLLVAHSLLRSAWALDQLGNLPIAQEQAERAAAEFESVGEKGGEAQAIRLTADIVDDANNHAAALPIFEKALVIFREIGYQSGAATALNNMAYALKDLGKPDAARKHFEESAAICRETGDLGCVARALNGAGTVLWRQGRLAEAEASYQTVLNHFRDAGSDNHAAVVLGNLAAVEQDAGKLSEAQHSFEQSLEMLKRLGDQTEIARTLGNLGELLLLRGEPVGAMAKFKEQLLIGDRIHQDKQRAYALQGMGEVYLVRGEYESAQKALNEALAMRTKQGEDDLANETKLTLAEVKADEIDLSAQKTARSLATDFLKQKRNDAAALARSIAIRAALNGRPADLSGAAAEARLVRGALPRIEDQAIRLTVRTELARYWSRTADLEKAKDEALNVIREASEKGYKIVELQASLALAEMELDPRRKADLIQKVDKESRRHGLIGLARAAQRLRAELKL